MRTGEEPPAAEVSKAMRNELCDYDDTGSRKWILQRG